MQLKHRSTEIELMDNPNMELSLLKEVFKDINRANELLGGNNITLNTLWDLLKKDINKSYTILDMGCGDGYMLRETALFLRKKNIKASLIGIDLREDILTIAREASMDFPEISYKKQDVLRLDPQNYSCDVLLCTLTMHHFKNEEILVFLNKFVSISKLGVIINDLHRNRLSCYLFMLFRIFFLKTHVTKIDGLISIKSGFLKQELEAFSRNIPNVTHTIAWKWAFRYVWLMKTNRL